MKVKEEALRILAECRTEGNVLYLPARQLSRPEYTAVNKVIETIGGKWNRKVGGHVFDEEPDLDSVLVTGEILDKKKVFQFFQTPRAVAELVCDMAELDENSRVLEPSCGKGALADVAFERGVKELKGMDLNPDMEKYLRDKPYSTVVGVDFLLAANALKDEGWNRIVMNPPFSKQQDVDHILAAFNVLAPGGILVAVCSESPFMRTNKKSEEFRAFLEEHDAETVSLEEGAFKDSGTMVRTRIVKLTKPS